VGQGKVVRIDAVESQKYFEREELMNKPSDFVITPGGLRHKSLVHLIEPNHILDGTGNRLRKLHRSGQVVTDFGEISFNLANTPLMSPDVVGAPQRVPDLESNWIVSADWFNNTGVPVSSFKTRWVVPQPPALYGGAGESIFLFNCLYNIQKTYKVIFQPVLQWGQSAAGGGEFWAVSCWLVYTPGGDACYSPLVQVNPGDVLVGIIQQVHFSGSLFEYNCHFEGIGPATLTMQKFEKFTHCAAALEAYYVPKCSGYPADVFTAFQAIEVQTGDIRPALNWAPVNRVTDCGQFAFIVSNANPGGEVDLYYRASSAGYFGKWYSNNEGDDGTSADFNYTGPRYIGGAPNNLPGAQLIPCDFDGDGKTDILVFRPDDGYFGKWYSRNDGHDGTSADFTYRGPRYIGGAPYNLPGAQLIRCDFNGDGKTDILVFRRSDGYFGKWYSRNDGHDGTSADFTYRGPRHIGGAPYNLPGALLIPCDFDGDGKTDILVFRSDDGYFGKWYSNNDGPHGRSADFTYRGPRYIGGAPYRLPGAYLIPCEFNGDRKTDILVFLLRNFRLLGGRRYWGDSVSELFGFGLEAFDL
jgi:hypothetical protein